MASNHARSRRLGTTRLRTAPFALLLAASGTLGLACGSDSGPRGSTVVVGTGDRTQNSNLSVDEPNIQGVIEDDILTVSVPVTSLLSRPSSGKLQLRLLSVDGATELSVVELPYSLEAEETGTLTGSIPAPQGLESQANLVSFNVRVDDGTPKGLRVTRSLLYVVPLYELRVEGPAVVRKGREASYRVRTHDAMRNRPLEAQEVTFEVMQNDRVQETHVVPPKLRATPRSTCYWKRPEISRCERA